MFGSLNIDLFRRCIQLVRDCLSEANMEKGSVHEILLMGGSTRIPMVQELLRQFFHGKELCRGVNTDEAIAFGATVLAASLYSKGNTAEAPNLNVIDVIPLPLFLSSNAGFLGEIISRNTIVPAQNIMRISFKTSCDYQQKILFRVFEENGPPPSGYNLVEDFIVSFLSPATHADLTLEICFDFNVDGILNVSLGNTAITFGRLREGKIEKKMKKLQGLCDPIIDKMHPSSTTAVPVQGAHLCLPDRDSTEPNSKFDASPDCFGNGAKLITHS